MFWSSGILTGSQTTFKLFIASFRFWSSGILTGSQTGEVCLVLGAKFWSSGILTGSQTGEVCLVLGAKFWSSGILTGSQTVLPKYEYRMVKMIFNYVPLPYFFGFTAFTPEVPKLYWDVKSQEQRYFTLCKEFHKMTCYANALADRINTITTDLETVMADFEAKVNAQLEAQNQVLEQWHSDW